MYTLVGVYMDITVCTWYPGILSIGGSKCIHWWVYTWTSQYVLGIPGY